jgi:hypothetical protein
VRGKRALEERISSSISSVEPASSTPARMTIARQPTCYTDTVSNVGAAYSDRFTFVRTPSSHSRSISMFERL